MDLAPKRLLDYIAFLDERGWHRGNWKRGEIEIVTDIQEILDVEEEEKERKKNDPQGRVPSWQVGIITRSRWFIFLRDAVIFPNGKKGLYERVVYAEESLSNLGGLAILPLSLSGKIILAVEFRHACRSWIAGVVGATTRNGERHEEAIRRSLSQNLGISQIERIFSIGQIVSDRGIIGSSIPAYLAVVDENLLGGGVVDPAIGGWMKVDLRYYLELRSAGSVSIPNLGNCLVQDAYADSVIVLARGKGLI